MLGLLIDAIQMVPNTTTAFVKFSTVGDVELALKKTNKDSGLRIYRSTERQMQSNRKKTNIQPLRPSRSSLRREVKRDLKPDNIHSPIKFVRVQGLPWTIDESFVMDLFPGKSIVIFSLLLSFIAKDGILFHPGLSIDQENGIKMERDHKGRFTGNAFVAFDNSEDFGMALNADLSAVNQSVL